MARKRPIEVLVFKKSLDFRPIAVNKDEIVKRMLDYNSDAEFVFCAGDDKVCALVRPHCILADMHLLDRRGHVPRPAPLPEPLLSCIADVPRPVRALVQGHQPSLSVTLLAGKDATTFAPVELAIERNAVFTTAVGHSSKHTLTVWHVTTPEEGVEDMIGLVALGEDKVSL